MTFSRSASFLDVAAELYRKEIVIHLQRTYNVYTQSCRIFRKVSNLLQSGNETAGENEMSQSPATRA